MFIEENCTMCGDCFVDCHWIDTDREEAAAWMEELINGERSAVLEKCVTCYACNERCPQQANPYDLIAELQDKYNTLMPAAVLESQEKKFTFTGEISDAPRADRIMSLCVFSKSEAHLIQGELYDLPRVAGKPYFCWILFSHSGAENIQRKHAQEFVDRLAATGAREIVCFHDDCYTMLTRETKEYGIDVPFRPIHFTEYLVEYLKENLHRVKPLNIDIAYTRPCASRLTPEKERFIDELFELVGVNRVERVYDRENAICCGGTTNMLQMGDPRPNQEKNIRDALDAGAQAMVCLCPMCIRQLTDTAAEMKMPLIFIGDIARMALGEIDILIPASVI